MFILIENIKDFCFFLKHNFAVQKSDFLNNDRVISEEANEWINVNLNKKYKLTRANSEITKEIKKSIVL